MTPRPPMDLRTALSTAARARAREEVLASETATAEEVHAKHGGPPVPPERLSAHAAAARERQAAEATLTRVRREWEAYHAHQEEEARHLERERQVALLRAAHRNSPELLRAHGIEPEAEEPVTYPPEA